MCDRCGFSGAHAVQLAERPAQRLVGYRWEGSHAEARGGALEPLLAAARRLSDADAQFWRSPIVVLTWNDRPNGFRQFAGMAGDDAPPGGTAIDLPPMAFASSWHGPEDGTVVAHYLRMIEWIGDEGFSRDTTYFAQREEYPPDLKRGGPPTLRLLLPLKTPPAG